MFLIIRIMDVLCAGNNCVAKENFPLTKFETDNKGHMRLGDFVA